MDPWVRKFRSGRWAGCSFNRGTSCDASAGVSGAHLGARETRPPDALPLHWPSAASPSFGARGLRVLEDVSVGGYDGLPVAQTWVSAVAGVLDPGRPTERRSGSDCGPEGSGRWSDLLVGW